LKIGRHWWHAALAVGLVLLIASGTYLLVSPRGSASDPVVAGPATTDPPTTQPPPTSAAPTPTMQPTPEPTTAAAKAPVGARVPMPGDIPGWKRTFADDFNGSLSQWGLYEGQPGGDPGGWFRRSHVTTVDGKAVIKASREDTPNGNIYASGGMNSGRSFSQTYGRFEFRFRMDEGYGVSFALLLWPNQEIWPPEIDIAEDRGKGRDLLHTSLHYGTANDHHQIMRDHDGVDTTRWHTAGVEWRPGRLDYLLDGDVWATVESDNVPDIAMVIAIQSQAWFCQGAGGWSDCPNSTTPPVVNLEVDWVVAYAAT
jgi:beta-glucanase (GH16 family)